MKKNLLSINLDQALVLSHKLRWKIMQALLQDEPIYAKQLAKKLDVSESKIHYHLTQLRRTGLIEIKGTRSIKQGRAKLLRPVATGFVLSLLTENTTSEQSTFNKLFLNRFFSSNSFNTKIVVGSSVPHGKYDAISRDGHLVGELCWYLGSKTVFKSSHNISNYVVTDIEFLLNNTNTKTNLILIGGHITNELTAKYNDVLKHKFNVYFSENRIISENNDYMEPSEGLIALFRNPDKVNNWILILAGVSSLGTKATIYSIINDCVDIFSDEDEFVTVLKGRVNKKQQISGITGLFTKSIK
jgi:DNA-binding transcriptional ArsR family regulator